MHTGRTPHEQEGRDQGSTSAGQGALTIANKPSEAPGESKGTSFAHPLISGFQPPEQGISVVTPLSVVLYYSNP